MGFHITSSQGFQEVATEWGIEHYHNGLYGGGVAIFDFNNDGFQDIYLTGGLFRDKLYKNNGNKTFTDVTLFSGFARTSQFNTSSVSVGDVNNDGYQDLFVGTYRNQRSLLYLNNGDNTFTDVSQESGIEKFEWAIGGAFGDFNLDGHLDLYVINYVQDERLITDENENVIGYDHDCFPNQLFLNNGDLTFTEITSQAINNNGCGLAVAVTDFNNDFLPDIYVVNDFGEWIRPNASLLNNRTDSVFSDISTATGLNAAIYGMGVAVGDYNRDGYLDYYASNIGSNVFYRNNGDGTFTDIAAETGTINTNTGGVLATSWGSAFFDYDLDGFEDLFVSNGFVPAAGFIPTSTEDPNQLYQNQGNGTFIDRAGEYGIDDVKISRGMAVGDLDNDGDLDMVVTIVGVGDDPGNVLIYENLVEDRRWLKVFLTGISSNIRGYGAKVYAFHEGVQWLHEIDGGSSHASHHAAVAPFGLGDVRVLDSVKVVWPGGQRQSFREISTNQSILIQQDQEEYHVLGCMDPEFDNYDPDATLNYGCYRDNPGCLDQISPFFDINANIPVSECGAEPLSAGHWGIRIFPNPAHDQVTISLADEEEADEFLLLSISGRIVKRGRMDQRTIAFQKGDIPSGVYILQLRKDQKTYLARKIVFR
jgi:hypothetical protein